MKNKLRMIMVIVGISLIFIIVRGAFESAASDSSIVRSDVDVWIQKNFAHSEKLQALLRQAAVDYQFLLTQVDDREKSIKAYNQLMRSQYCGQYISKSLFSRSPDIFDQLLAQILNSYSLSRAWIRANKNMVGVPFYNLPESQWKNGCRFDPDRMSK